MSEILVEIDDSSYREWVDETKNRYKTMVQTMENVAEIIRLATIPYVPLDTSALEQSYEYHVTNQSPYILLTVGFDAEDEKTGFHYAQYQHDNFLNHPRRGVPFYLTVGIHDAKFEFIELIEQDYLSLFFGNSVATGRVGDNTHAHFIKYVNM